MLHTNSSLVNYLDCLNACKGKMFHTVKIPLSSGPPSLPSMFNDREIFKSERRQCMLLEYAFRNSYQMVLVVACGTSRLLLRFTPTICYLVLLHSKGKEKKINLDIKIREYYKQIKIPDKGTSRKETF